MDVQALKSFLLHSFREIDPLIRALWTPLEAPHSDQTSLYREV